MVTHKILKKQKSVKNILIHYVYIEKGKEENEREEKVEGKWNS